TNPELLERQQVVVSKCVRAERASDIAIAVVPKSESLEERPAQDDLLGVCERFDVPDAAALGAQEHVERRAFAKMGVNLSAIDIHDAAGAVGSQDWKDHAAIEVFATGSAIKAELM